MKNFLIGSLVLFLSLTCFAQDFDKDYAKKVAYEATKELESTLKKELKKAKRSNKTEGMTDYCINDSMKVVEDLNKKLAPKVLIKRISLNNRNDKAKASKEEEKILQAFDLLSKSNAYQPDEIVQIIDDDTYKVYSPITMNSRDCKKCHGVDSKVDKESKKRFSEVYKNDRGYGYKSGDVRGAVVVTISR